MSRAYDISDFAAFLRKYGNSGRDSESRSEKPSRDASQRTRPDRGRNQESRLSRNGYDRSRTIYRSRNREYSLRESEVQTLTDLGKFRMVPADDLAQFAYRRDRSQMASDLRNLSRQGLIEQRSIEGPSMLRCSMSPCRLRLRRSLSICNLSRQGLIEQRSIEGHSSYSTKVLTLTRDAHRLLERAQLVSHRQTIYHGLVKRSEEHTSELQSRLHLVCRLLLEKKKTQQTHILLILARSLCVYKTQVGLARCNIVPIYHLTSHYTIHTHPERTRIRLCLEPSVAY